MKLSEQIEQVSYNTVRILGREIRAFNISLGEHTPGPDEEWSSYGGEFAVAFDECSIYEVFIYDIWTDDVSEGRIAVVRLDREMGWTENSWEEFFEWYDKNL